MMCVGLDLLTFEMEEILKKIEEGWDIVDRKGQPADLFSGKKDYLVWRKNQVIERKAPSRLSLPNYSYFSFSLQKKIYPEFWLTYKFDPENVHNRSIMLSKHDGIRDKFDFILSSTEYELPPNLKEEPPLLRNKLLEDLFSTRKILEKDISYFESEELKEDSFVKELLQFFKKEMQFTKKAIEIVLDYM